MGIVSVNLPVDGETIDAADYNVPITSILGAINGNLDENNINPTSNPTVNNLTVNGTLSIGSENISKGWTPIPTVPTTITNLGQGSYSLLFPGVDYTNILSPGQRVRTTRTVAAPTQSTSLNGTNQYWVKTSPNKLTFTDDFVIEAWIYPTAYQSSTICSRRDATQGWQFQMSSSGQIQLFGFNGGTGNQSYVQSYQSIPLNKWTHVVAQLDMSSFTATTTTSYIMINGINVPALVNRAGTNPTSLVQAGNLEIGSVAVSQFFAGKIAQVAIYNAKVTQAQMRTYMSQGLTGSETSLASAYSFNGVATDLNTTTPNDLTAQNSAGYTSLSPFGTQGSGLISSTLDYGIVQSATFSTDTTAIVQVPEGCTIPTSGGLSAISYSGLRAPYGFPADTDKWTIYCIQKVNSSSTSISNTVIANINSFYITLPISKNNITALINAQVSTTTANTGVVLYSGISTTTNSFTECSQLFFVGVSLSSLINSFTLSTTLTTAAQSPCYVNIRCNSVGTLTGGFRGDEAACIIKATNAYL